MSVILGESHGEKRDDLGFGRDAEPKYGLEVIRRQRVWTEAGDGSPVSELG